MELEKIDKAVIDSLEHGNNKSGEPAFTIVQMELITEAIKAALESYHNQSK